MKSVIRRSSLLWRSHYSFSFNILTEAVDADVRIRVSLNIKSSINYIHDAIPNNMIISFERLVEDSKVQRNKQ